MDLPEITKKPSIRQEIIATSAGLRKRFASVELLMAGVLVLVFLVELFALYTFLYKNIVLDDTTAQAKTTAAVRINFDNYNQVIRHLDDVAQYHPSPNIDFRGNGDNTGRDNPFAEPQ